MPSRAWIVTIHEQMQTQLTQVSMPSRAWIVTAALNANRKGGMRFNALTGLNCYIFCWFLIFVVFSFNALTGLNCYPNKCYTHQVGSDVSMPSRAWIVTARMSNILNFSWYFLCIPAIYRCILAHLPFFSTNYLSFWGANPLVLFWELAFRTTLL